ncbi:MOSC domain containing protein [Alkalidesulfovibrio alkalitolerans DSM 16529]|jgi:MOSC domain-containing protein YiiM|uniref:MOSC domain containing protein n=1 Tax=Alkalidesulfovibrio alkalitolerans DSM 16529 TaxID=1121439 RepID=S7UQ87_9BACT|nr:MOSC domain-containing protein [Alkalidesulfovibrio alkalitolerans]EPR36209.1 MOSC domain containing protein [Alkalidesulfovibrio alkalitolerans DSM 16529]
MRGEIAAVCTSEKTGISKTPVECIELVADYGVKGDAHGGGERQVSLLAEEAVAKVGAKHPGIGPGSYAENLLLRGIDPASLPLGARLKVGGNVLLEITQIGKKCHSKCAIHQQVGSCIMPKMGVFARVLSGGTVRPGDAAHLLD